MGDEEEAVEAGPVDPDATAGYTAREGLKKSAVWIALLSCLFVTLASSSMLQHGIPTLIMSGQSPAIATFISSLISIALIGTNIIIG
ncbi:hypothetical protein LH384_33275, partial [Pseudomonas aeruginosa]|nr:hypothetical protein [Pseudomonas aeruginosa]